MVGNQLFNNINTILRYLFEREEANLARRESEMVLRHAAMGGSQDGFRHLGMVYTRLAGAARKRGHYDRLPLNLVPEMGSILTSKKVIEADKARIKQALALVLQDTRSYQDMRNALPNCLQHLIPECNGLERTREEAYTIRDNPRAFSQYMMLRDRIEFYVAARLLY